MVGHIIVFTAIQRKKRAEHGMQTYGISGSDVYKAMRIFELVSTIVAIYIVMLATFAIG